MQGELTEEVSRLLNENLMTDIRSKFGFSIPKDTIRPLITRVETAVMCALGDLPVKLIYTHVDRYEEELELFIIDMCNETRLDDARVREKINTAVDGVCDKLYDFIVTWKRVERINTAHAVRGPAQNPRKNQNDSRQARNHHGQHFTR